MKNFKTILHIMITVASLLGFLGGWATLAHSIKPTQTTSGQSQVIDPLPPLDPIPAIGNSSNTTDSNGLNIVVPPTSQSSVNNSTSANNSTSINNSNNTAGTTRLSRRARPVFTTTGS